MNIAINYLIILLIWKGEMLLQVKEGEQNIQRQSYFRNGLIHHEPGCYKTCGGRTDLSWLVLIEHKQIYLVNNAQIGWVTPGEEVWASPQV